MDIYEQKEMDRYKHTAIEKEERILVLGRGIFDNYKLN